MPQEVHSVHTTKNEDNLFPRKGLKVGKVCLFNYCKKRLGRGEGDKNNLLMMQMFASFANRSWATGKMV